MFLTIHFIYCTLKKKPFPLLIHFPFPLVCHVFDHPFIQFVEKICPLTIHFPLPFFTMCYYVSDHPSFNFYKESVHLPFIFLTNILPCFWPSLIQFLKRICPCIIHFSLLYHTIFLTFPSFLYRDSVTWFYPNFFRGDIHIDNLYTSYWLNITLKTTKVIEAV